LGWKSAISAGAKTKKGGAWSQYLSKYNHKQKEEQRGEANPHWRQFRSVGGKRTLNVYNHAQCQQKRESLGKVGQQKGGGKTGDVCSFGKQKRVNGYPGETN